MAVAIDPDLVEWSDPGRLDGRPLLVLLHGYGQDEHGLAGIAEAVAPGIVTAALRGPRPSRAPLAGGYGWYDVDERIRPLAGQEAETTGALLDWLDAVVAERGAPSRLAVAGFSQGAALTLHLLRTAPERWDAVVTLGGYWLPTAAPADDRLAELRPAVFWGRTEGDPAIAPAYIEATRAALAPIAPDAEHVYPGDVHAVVPDELVDLTAFLKARLEA